MDFDAVDLFMMRFNYVVANAGFLGVEREHFLANMSGDIGCHAFGFLRNLKGTGDAFGFELSACQLETRVGPLRQEKLRRALVSRDAQLTSLLDVQGLRALNMPVAPHNMPLDVYPDPRYLKMAASMPVETLRAACRVAGTHIHVGLPNHSRAIHVYNHAIKHTDRLCTLGDRSGGERLKIYRDAAPRTQPEPYTGWAHYWSNARLHGFEEDPRKCHTLIRISVHGTIEFRMFDATDDVDDVMLWANECLEICRSAPD